MAYEESATADFRILRGDFRVQLQEQAGRGPSFGRCHTPKAVIKFCETTEPAGRHLLSRLLSCQCAAEALGLRIMNSILTAGDRTEVGISGRHM